MPSEALKRNQPKPTDAASYDKLPDWRKWEDAKERVTKLVGVMDEMEQVVLNSRHLRYTQIDIEAERKCGRLAPDELYVPQHIIDTNIRREQARYVAYINSTRRAVVLENLDDPSQDTSVVERDFTDRVRYDGWQVPMYRFIDGMQQNGYGVIEMVMDVTMPGHLKFQDVNYGDFGYSLDSKEEQGCEMLLRRHYFTKTQLLAMTDAKTWGFDKEQVGLCVTTKDTGTNDYKEQSLYKVEKVMFRIKGVVHVGWSCQIKCNDWLRKPRPLYLGRQTLDIASGQWVKAYETAYPFFIAEYNISENTIIRQMKGRSYLDQDSQEGVTSLMSSYVTAHRRASGLYFAREETDPNSDVVTQSNVHFKQGCLINGKVKQFQLQPPDASMLGAIQGLASMNAQENAQINYAANNRQDSRKTATEIQAAQTESQLLSTIQMALFSTTMKEIYKAFWDIFVSRVKSGAIADVRPAVAPMYQANYRLKPAGDTDVVERQEKLLRMQQAWPVVENTPIAMPFLAKLLQLMFPEDAPMYISLLQQDQTKNMTIQSLQHVLQGLIADPTQLSDKARQHIPALVNVLQQSQLVNAPPQMKQAIQKRLQNHQVRQVADQLEQPQQPTQYQ